MIEDMLKTCKNCNIEFKTYKRNQIYCSRECSTEANNKKKVYYGKKED